MMMHLTMSAPPPVMGRSLSTRTRLCCRHETAGRQTMITQEEWMDLLSYRQMAAIGATWAEIAHPPAATGAPPASSSRLRGHSRHVTVRGRRARR
jgi:hypothetical protein